MNARKGYGGVFVCWKHVLHTARHGREKRKPACIDMGVDWEREGRGHMVGGKPTMKREQRKFQKAFQRHRWEEIKFVV